MNDVFKQQYKELTAQEQQLIGNVKKMAQELYDVMNTAPAGRELSLANTQLEQSVMWFVKGICK